jgi:hypothetical protein
MKTRIAANFARSAKAPTISPQVMAAKAPWKMTIGQFGDDHALAEGGADRVDGDPLEEDLVEHAKEATAFGEGHRVAVDHPEHADQREGHEDLHQHREHVLGAHQAAVEQRQARDRHQDDQRGAGHHPGVVALVGDQAGAAAGAATGSALAAAAATGAAASGSRTGAVCLPPRPERRC